MLKRIIPIVIVLCLVFGISALAENTNDVTDNSDAGETQQIPQSERPQGGRGNMGMPQDGNMQGRVPGNMPKGEFTLPEGVTPPNGEFTPPQDNANTDDTKTETPTMDDGASENSQTQNNFGWAGQSQGGNRQFGGQMPGGMGGFSGNMQNFNGQTQNVSPKGFWGFVKTYSTPITSVVLLGLAFIFVVFYRRKNY